MGKIVIVKLAPEKNIPRNTYVVKTKSMSGDADLYQTFTKRILNDDGVLSVIATLYFFMQRQDHRRQVDYSAIEEEVKSLGLQSWHAGDLIYDMVGQDATVHDGRIATLVEITLSWFNEQGVEYICAFNKPGTEELVEVLRA